MSGRRVAAAGAAVALAVLSLPPVAAAHSRAPTIALDVRLDLHSRPGVRAQVIDGNRWLRLTVDPARSLAVRGLLGEPFLRFDRAGVYVDRGSPTAAADRIVTGRGSGWARVAGGHSFTWHDHRLAPPRGLAAGATAPFSLPVFLDGRPTVITGRFTAAARPPWWLWLAAAALALPLIAVAAARAPRRRDVLAWTAAVAAAAGAFVATLGFATGVTFARASLWLEAAVAAGLLLVAVGGLLKRRLLRTWTASLVGAAAVVICLRDVPVFWHGVVISSLSPALTRVAVLVAIAGGLAAAGISFAAEDDPVPSRSG